MINCNQIGYSFFERVSNMKDNKQETIIERMEDKQKFTNIEQSVIDYILVHRQEVTEMNIGDLAKATFTSNGTIIRICRKLDCEGFRQLKHELTRDLEMSRYANRNVDFNAPFDAHQSVMDIIDSMADLYRESITVTQHNLNQRYIREAAQLMNKSNRIFIYAVGDTMITTEAFSNKLVKLGIFPIIASGFNDNESVTQGIKANDVALFVSYSGDSLITNISTLKENHVPIIGITATNDSPICKLSDILILIPKKEGDRKEKMATFYSQVALSYVLNILYSLLHVLKKQ